MKDLLSDVTLEDQVQYLYTATAKELYNFALMVCTVNSMVFEYTVDSFAEAFVEISSREKVNDIPLFKFHYLKRLYKYGKNINARREQDPLPSHTDDQNNLITKLGLLSYTERFVLLLFCHQKCSMKCIARIIQRPKFLVTRFLLSAVDKLNT